MITTTTSYVIEHFDSSKTYLTVQCKSKKDAISTSKRHRANTSDSKRDGSWPEGHNHRAVKIITTREILEEGD